MVTSLKAASFRSTHAVLASIMFTDLSPKDVIIAGYVSVIYFIYLFYSS